MSVLEQGIYFIEGKILTEVSNEINEISEEEAAIIYPENRLFRYRPNINYILENGTEVIDINKTMTVEKGAG